MPRFFNPISSFDETESPQRFSSCGITHESHSSTIDHRYCSAACQKLVERDTVRKMTEF